MTIDMTHRNNEGDRNNNYHERLKQAVRSGTEVPPFLASRILSRIDEKASNQARQPLWLAYWKPALAAAAFCLVVGLAFQLRQTTEQHESYIASVSNRVATLMRVGLGNHLHCAVFGNNTTKTPPPVQEFVRDLGPKYAGLLPVVRQQVPAKYTMSAAHQCSYHKRKFVHLSLAGEGNLVSLIIAHKEDGESFRTEGFLPSLVRSGIPVYQAGVDKFSMHAFESRDYLVYVVSDLPGARNEEMMVALAEPVRNFLNQL